MFVFKVKIELGDGQDYESKREQGKLCISYFHKLTCGAY